MSRDVSLSKDDRQRIYECLTYCIDNIAQEDTNKEEYLHTLKLQKQFRQMCPWIEKG